MFCVRARARNAVGWAGEGARGRLASAMVSAFLMVSRHLPIAARHCYPVSRTSLLCCLRAQPRNLPRALRLLALDTACAWCNPPASNTLCLRTRRTNRQGFFDTPRYWRHFSAGARASWDLYLQGYSSFTNQGSVCLRMTGLCARSLDAVSARCRVCLSLVLSSSLHLSHTCPCTQAAKRMHILVASRRLRSGQDAQRKRTREKTYR